MFRLSSFIATDESNCGGCGITCPAGEFCRQGVCGPCPPDQTPCNGGCFPGAECLACPDPERSTRCTTNTSFDGHRCVDLLTDPSACGACDRSCLATETCQSGQCVPGTPVGVPELIPSEIRVRRGRPVRFALTWTVRYGRRAAAG